MWKKIRMIIGDELEGTAVSCFEKNKCEKISSIFQRKKGKFQNYLRDATIF